MTQGVELPTVVDLTPDRLTANSERRRRASALRGGAVSPKITRLLVLASMAAGFGVLPMSGARADTGVVGYDLPGRGMDVRDGTSREAPGRTFG